MPNDFLLDDQFELRIEAGDFVVDDSTTQESRALLMAAPGDYFHEPILGVNLSRYVGAPFNDDVRGELRREIEVQHELDGLEVVELTFGTNLSDTQLDVRRP